jgi:leucyl aminopeptidase
VTKNSFFKEITHNSYVPQAKPLEKLAKEVARIRKEKEQQLVAPVQDPAPPAPEFSSASGPAASQVPASAPATTLVSEVTPQATLNAVSNLALEVKQLRKDFDDFKKEQEKSQKLQQEMVLALQGLAKQVARIVEPSSSSSKPAEDPSAPPPRSS